MVWIIPQFFKKMFYFLEKVKSLFSHSPLSVLFLLSGLDSASQQAGLNNCQRIFFFFQRILTVDSCLVAEWLALASNGNRAWALESHRLSLGNKPTTYIFLAKCLYIFLKFFLMGTIFEVFIEFVPMFFVLCFAFLATGMWTLVLPPGIESTPPALEGEVLTSGPPGKSPFSWSWLSVLISLSLNFLSIKRVE